jgi:hypothetical protein
MVKQVVLGLGLLVAACSASAGGSGSDGPDPAGRSTGSTGQGSGASSNAGGSLQLGGSVGTAGSDAVDMGCASESREARAVPTDLMVLVDQSGSMTLEGSRWDPTATALKAFFQNSMFDGLGVGLQYFPLGASKTEDPAICQSPNYVMPDVPIGALPDNSGALVASVDAHHFTAAEGDAPAHWGTPTRPAVEGVLQYLASYQAQHLDRRLYLLLATDGLPSKLCTGNDIDGIATVLAVAAALTPPVQTFVIGIGEIARLNTLAMAGGTGNAAFIVDAVGTQTQAQFSAALEAIRHTALPCEFTIPEPSVGRIDPGQVNVELTNGAGKVTFPKVTAASSCVAGETGWYYDDDAAPTQVIMCPSACDTLKAGNAKIDIVFGCKTVTK